MPLTPSERSLTNASTFPSGENRGAPSPGVSDGGDDTTRRSPVSGDSSTIWERAPGADTAGNAMSRPSGDQSMPGAQRIWAVSANSRSDPPRADISMTDSFACPRTNAIRRPSGDQHGQAVRRGVRGQPDRSVRPHQHHVDVVVVFLRAVPREGHLLPVGGERGMGFVSGERGERHQSRRLRLRPRHGPPPCPPRPRRSITETTATAHASRRRGRARAGDGAAGLNVPESDSSFSSSSATRTSSMCWKRLSGSLRRQRRMHVSRSRGSPSSGFGSWCRTADSVEIVLSPVNARRPVTIS